MDDVRGRIEVKVNGIRLISDFIIDRNVLYYQPDMSRFIVEEIKMNVEHIKVAINDAIWEIK